VNTEGLNRPLLLVFNFLQQISYIMHVQCIYNCKISIYSSFFFYMIKIQDFLFPHSSLNHIRHCKTMKIIKNVENIGNSCCTINKLFLWIRHLVKSR